MLNEILEIIQFSFQNYQGTGMYLALFFVAMVYLYLKENDSDKKILLVYFPILVLCIILNPMLGMFLIKGLERLTYVRLFWILPMGIGMAYTMTKIVEPIRPRWKKLMISLAFIWIIILSGKCVYRSENYALVHNSYKLPDEVVEIVRLISEDEKQVKKVMLPETLVSYIRQIDASIELYYGRKSTENYDDIAILQDLKNGEVEKVASTCKKAHCNYIIFSQYTPLKGNMEEFGYALYAQTQNYVIYVLQEN